MAVGYTLGLATQAAMFANHLGMLDGYRFLRACLVKSQVAILMYHRVVPKRDIWFFPYSITVSDFENQLIYLIKQYTLLSLDELVDHISEQKPLPKKAVVITFDDGYKDNYIYACPILKKYNVPAAIFLVSDYIGTGELFWWDKVSYAIYNTALESLGLGQLGTYSLRSAEDKLRAISNIITSLNELIEEQKNLVIEDLVDISGVNIPVDLGKELILSWDEIREMSNNGITFGAHTATHPILTKLLLEEARKQIIKSKKRIEEEIGHAVTLFSYPNGAPGDYNEDIKEFLRASGFTCAVTGVPPRLVTPGTDVYELGRTSPGWNFDTFKFYLKLFPDLRSMLGRVMGAI